MHPPKSSGAVGKSMDIDPLLKGCIDSSLSDATATTDAAAGTQTETVETNSEVDESSDTRVDPEPTRNTILLANELSEHLKNQDSARELQQRMGERLQANTLEHINRALRLAKQGNRECNRI